VPRAVKRTGVVVAEPSARWLGARANRRRGRSALRGARRGLATVEFIVLLTCIAVGGVLMWKVMGTTIVSIIGEE
jgi:hypothetical protein